MKKINTILLFLFCSFIHSQSGINYKALIKDANGNVISNQQITVELTLLQTQALDVVYEETHTPTTDANGLIDLIIGTGSTTYSFGSVEWQRGELVLNVQIDIGNGLVDLGTTEFQYVPFAYATEIAAVARNVNGLEAINEGNGIGWRLIGSDPDNYGDLGAFSVDLSYSSGLSTTRGATGSTSTALGANTIASGGSSLAAGLSSQATGYNTVAMGSWSTASGGFAVAIGRDNEASGSESLALGSENLASGFRAKALGNNTIAQSYNSTAIGRYNLGGGESDSWNDFDPLFEIGNGNSNTSRSNALTVRKDGSQILNSDSFGMLINTGSSVSNYGLRISNSGGNGIEINSAGDDGMTISANNNGLVISADNQGARISGDNVGVYASGGSISQPDVPDIILGSSNNTLFSDDGIISTNPERSGSDMFLRSYDAVVVQLDYDSNETGNFRVRNGDQDVIFDVAESGNVNIEGRLRIGTANLHNINTNFLEINKSTIPSSDGQFSLGADTRRWANLWAVDGTINTSDRREKKNIKDINYGLAEVLKMHPVSFNWKNKNMPDTKLGLIAQDLLNLVPEVVKTHTWEKEDATGTLTKKKQDRFGVYYSDLVPVLIRAIQEQQEQIESLKQDLANYKNMEIRLKNLEAKL